MMTRANELLHGLDDEQTDALRALGVRRRVAPGERLFSLGDAADDLFLVERGRLALTLPMRVGDRDEEVLIEERQAGQALGWSALIPPHRFTLTAKALADTEVLALGRDRLRTHFEANPEVGYIVARNVAAIVGQRLHVFQAMWLREMQRVVRFSHA
ncbi:MAG: Crp/Fnr family transcriptional regulator [Betaproteobacteria bacterium]